jgi:hypothetical protein
LFEKGFSSASLQWSLSAVIMRFPYVAQQAVQTYHWLSAGQMLDGLGLAEWSRSLGLNF